MLDHYLQNAIDDIDSLIEITKEDIENIIEARHEKIFERTKIKDDILNSFMTKKVLIDNELLKIKQEHGNNFAQAIPQDIKELLSVLEQKFIILKQENKKYAKFVLQVSEFYSSLLGEIVPKNDSSSYKDSGYKSTFLKVQA
jgi:hypothetical protein